MQQNALQELRAQQAPIVPVLGGGGVKAATVTLAQIGDFTDAQAVPDPFLYDGPGVVCPNPTGASGKGDLSMRDSVCKLRKREQN